MSYSWGDETEGTKSRTSGYDYAEARRAYEPTPPPSRSGEGSARSSESSSGWREASESVSTGIKRSFSPPPIGENFTTESPNPLVILLDHTGSMAENPEIVLEKGPILVDELPRYLPDYELSICIFGDSRHDPHPLQARPPASGVALKEHFSGVQPDGDGGDDPESHNLAAYFYLKHFEMPNAVRPILIFITDVYSHDSLKPEEVRKYTGDVIQEPIPTKEIMAALGQKFEIYVLLRGYRKGSSIVRWWENFYGPQHVLPFVEPRDVVELIVGLVAMKSGRIEDFAARSSKRHSDKPDRVTRVLESVSRTRVSEGSGERSRSTDSKKSRDLA